MKIYPYCVSSQWILNVAVEHVGDVEHTLEPHLYSMTLTHQKILNSLKLIYSFFFLWSMNGKCMANVRREFFSDTADWITLVWISAVLDQWDMLLK